MPPPDIVPLVGHHALRTRLAQSVERGTLPASLLVHGPPGVGKQRLALWLAQRLLCTGGRHSEPSRQVEPCGSCQACRFSAVLQHPDLHWVFPLPRDKRELSPQEVRHAYAEVIEQRVGDHLLYSRGDGSHGIFRYTVGALVQAAVLAPAMGARKVIVVGNAERMVSQEGSDQAANAFLKLLEEPPSDTTIILTSSASGALLPTIRSRVVALRVPRLPEQDVAIWVGMGAVRAALDAARVDGTDEERVRRAAGAPGTLLGVAQSGVAATTARAMVDAAMRRQPALQYATALRQGSAGARGAFADALSGLTTLLHAQLRSAVDRQDVALARATCHAIADVEEAKTRVDVNANPQLLTGRLLRDMATAFGAIQ